MLSTLTNRWGTLLSDPFEAVRREFDRNFGFTPIENATSQFRRYGALSLWEDQQHVYIEMDVPGMSIENLQLTLEKGQLWIRGERQPVEREPQSRIYDERTYGRFQRVVSLHDAVDPGSVDASLKNGVLCITLTKRAEYQPYRIAVKEGTSEQGRIASS